MSTPQPLFPGSHDRRRRYRCELLLRLRFPFSQSGPSYLSLARNCRCHRIDAERPMPRHSYLGTGESQSLFTGDEQVDPTEKRPPAIARLFEKVGFPK